LISCREPVAEWVVAIIASESVTIVKILSAELHLESFHLFLGPPAFFICFSPQPTDKFLVSGICPDIQFFQDTGADIPVRSNRAPQRIRCLNESAGSLGNHVLPVIYRHPQIPVLKIHVINEQPNPYSPVATSCA